MDRLNAGDMSRALDLAARSDSKLVLIVGRTPTSLREAARSTAVNLSWRKIDLNLQLTRRLLPHTRTERQDLAWDALRDVVGEHPGGVVLVSTDILFEPTLGFRPYEALRRLGRSGPVVAAWFGTVDGYDIVRAQPGHPEYSRNRLDVPYVSASGSAGT